MSDRNHEMNPIEIKISGENGPGYIRYARGKVAGTLEVWENGWVAADFDADDQILGIEVLSLNEETLKHAREFAESRGLSFPDLRTTK